MAFKLGKHLQIHLLEAHASLECHDQGKASVMWPGMNVPACATRWWSPWPMEVPPASASMSVEPQVICSLDRAIVGTDRPRSRRDLGRSRNRSCWGDESGHGAWVSAACKAVEGVQIDHKNDLRPPSTAIHAHGERALIPFFDLPRHSDVGADIIVSCGQGEDYE